MDVRLPDGTVIQGVPDNITKAELVTKLKGNGMAVPSEWLEEAPKQTERNKTSTVGAAVAGLGAGFGNAVLGAQQLAGKTLKTLGAKEAGGWLEKDAREGRARLAAQSRPYKEDSPIVTGAGELVGSIVPTLPIGGVLGKGATAIAGRVAPKAAATASAALTSGGTAQGLGLGARIAGGAGTGAVTGAVMDPDNPGNGALVGGLMGGAAGAAAPAITKIASKGVNAAERSFTRLKDLARGNKGATMAAQEMQIKAALKSAGVDWNKLSKDVQQALHKDVQQALQVGDDLSPEALRRLADFRSVGATPTRGTLTLDPVQITREKNLAKTGANSTVESAQRLANVESANNQTLISNMNSMGAGRIDGHDAGKIGINSMQDWLSAQKANVDSLYQAARDGAGRSAPLDGHTFTTQASKLLDDNLLGYALPKDVQTHLNRIAQGEVPFNVDFAEQLKTVMAQHQRDASDGATRRALGMVRQALEETPLLNAGQDLGDDAIAAFTKARAANRSMMQQIESAPALKGLYEGKIAPDDFIRRHVTGQGAKVREVAELYKVLDANGKQALRDGVLGELKAAAVGASNDEIAKFSASGFRNALDRIGDRKLALIFSPKEVSQLKALSRVADYTTTQPVGSAVWNSNTPAGMAGMAMGAMKMLGQIPGFGTLGSLGSDGLQLAIRTSQQAHAMNAAGAVAAKSAAKADRPLVPLRRLLGSAGVGAGMTADDPRDQR